MNMTKHIDIFLTKPADPRLTKSHAAPRLA